jgi:hypothetical protein
MSSEPTKPIRQADLILYSPGDAFLWPCPRTVCVVPGFLDNRVDGFGRVSRHCRHCDKVWLDPMFFGTGEPYTLPLFDGLIISEFRFCYQTCIHCGKDLWDAEFAEVKTRGWDVDFYSCIFKLDSGKLAILVRVKTTDTEDPEVEMEEGWRERVNDLWRLTFQSHVDEFDEEAYMKKLSLEDWKQEPLTLDAVNWKFQKPLEVTAEISKDVLKGNVDKL